MKYITALLSINFKFLFLVGLLHPILYYLVMDYIILFYLMYVAMACVPHNKLSLLACFIQPLRILR